MSPRPACAPFYLRLASRLCLFAVAAAALAAPTQAAHTQAAPAQAVPVQTGGTEIEHGTFTVHLLLHAIGHEEYTVTRDSGGRRTLHTASTVDDRGTERSLAATLTLSAGGRPVLFAQRSTVGGVSSVSTVTIATGTATFELAGVPTTVPTTVPAPPNAFPALPGMPAAVEMELLRFWKAHGRPASLPLLRAPEIPAAGVSAPGASVSDARPEPQPDTQPDVLAPALPVEIREVGHDAFQVHGRTLRLTRYTVANLVFGREVVWMNDANRLAAVMTFAGGLPQETILNEYEAAADPLFQSGVQQQLLDFAALGRAVPPLAQGSFAVVGARLVDGTGADPAEGRTVVVRGGRIASISAAPPPPGLHVVHAEGQTLLPGLWDMHVHFSGVEFGPALLGAGITTARDCGGEFSFLLAARRAIEVGHEPGPRLLLAGLVDSGGPLGFGSVDVETPAEAETAVRFYARSHFDQIKVYTQLQPAVLRALAAAAHREGLTVTGHVPAAVPLALALELGMDQVSHLQFITRAMLPPAPSTSGAAPVPGLVDLGSPRAAAVIALLLRHGTVVDPTLSWGELAGRPRTLAIDTFEPGLRHAPATLRARYGALGSSTVDLSAFRAHMANNVAVVGALFRAGVPIVAGSDTGLPGFGLDRELELYVQAGMSPMAAIQSATLVAARAMHHEADSGTLEVGKRADMLLVEGNPLADIRALRQPTFVVTDGRLYDARRLRASVGFR